MLTVNNPNRQMVLERNPNFHGETYRRKVCRVTARPVCWMMLDSRYRLLTG
jgi:hypothetical protein